MVNFSETVMASRVTALEAKTRFGRLLDRVAQGEEIVVTRHDKPVARIIPAVAGLRELRRAIAMRREPDPALTNAEIKSLIEDGRR